MDKKVLYTIIDKFEVTSPQSIAVIDSETSISYATMKRRSDLLARRLLNFGIHRTDIISVLMESSVDYVVTVLAIMKSGAVFMPISPSLPDERIKIMVALSGCRLIIAESSVLPRAAMLFPLMPTWVREVVSVDTFGPTDSSTFPVVAGDDAAYLVFTSGSTGDPKAILGVHKSLSHFVHWETGEFKLDSNCRTLQLAPVGFDVSFRDIFVPLLVGGTVVIPTRGDILEPRKLFNWIVTHNIQLIHVVPSIFRVWLKMMPRLLDI
jgi:non-ribosomal peptide synthetase component F